MGVILFQLQQKPGFIQNPRFCFFENQSWILLLFRDFLIHSFLYTFNQIWFIKSLLDFKTEFLH